MDKNISIKTGFSEEKNEHKAVEAVFNKINQENIKLIIAFIDGGYDQLKINNAWKERIPSGAEFIACPSLKIETPFYKIGKNITPEGFKYCLTAMSISSDKIEVAIKVIENVKENWKEGSEKALKEAAKEINLDLKTADPKKHFGIFFCDTMSARDGDMLEILHANSGLFFVGGGSIGKMDLDSWIFKGKSGKDSCLHTKEGLFNNSAAIALIRCEVPFKIDLTTSFYPTPTKFKITKASEVFVGKTKMYSIEEFDGKPAAEEYIKALAVSSINLGFSRLPNIPFFATHPLGLMMGDRAYIRYIGVRKGKALLMPSKIEEGQTLYLMERGDIIKTTQDSIDKIKNELGSVSGVIFFHCGLRTLEANRFKKENELIRAMNIAPMMGICTFREYYGWLSVEQSAVILAFGE